MTNLNVIFSKPGEIIEDMWKGSPTRTNELGRAPMKCQLIITLDEANEVATIQYSGTHQPPATAIAYQDPYKVAKIIDTVLAIMNHGLPCNNLKLFAIQDFAPSGMEHVVVNRSTRSHNDDGDALIPEVVN